MSYARYFVALREKRNFTKASRRCGISQRSLTNAIKRLEAELGGALFRRGHFDTEMTALGDEYAPFIEVIWHCSLAIERLAEQRSAESGYMQGLPAQAETEWRQNE